MSDIESSAGAEISPFISWEILYVLSSSILKSYSAIPVVNPSIDAYSTIIMDLDQNESTVTAAAGRDVFVDGVFLLFNFLRMVTIILGLVIAGIPMLGYYYKNIRCLSIYCVHPALRSMTLLKSHFVFSTSM